MLIAAQDVFTNSINQSMTIELTVIDNNFNFAGFTIEMSIKSSRGNIDQSKLRLHPMFW